ncbi:hypothetical protein Glove_151g175 [Diversispora epigaea]|uniref:Protein kinase domain-containing protein n=1 Tax=Diversispora epigaea TaxID=1348612 RepID=A0A397IZA9_9GLOM|nr:hypothetical protein Glove_151g175 [Diversispora epigaea]
MKEMKETRKTEEMKETGEMDELDESGESDNNCEKCSKCYQDNTGRNWCHPCNSKQFQNEFDFWSSGDREIDKFIQQIQLNANKFQDIIEWIPFGRLQGVTYLANGGFGRVYKANWLDGFIKCSGFGNQNVWYRYGKQSVCLKSLGNSINKNDFLQEIKNQLKFRGKNSIAIYGITKNPTENEYMIVMSYAKYGSLRNLLNNKFEVLTFRRKSRILSKIVEGLKNIHEMGLMHKDFHSVTDICKGHKPEIKYEIPRFFKEIMEKCWNFEPPNRPMAKELKSQFDSYSYGGEIRKQVKAANKSNRDFIQYNPNKMHPEAIYTSRLIPKPTIPEYDTFNSRQQFFSIPDNIIVEDEENETQEMECKFNSLEIN